MIKSSPKDLQIEVEQLTGFYRGVVEDNKDPLMAGRVRVRIHGIHTPKKQKSDIEGIPTEELPWAEPCMPIHEGSVSGFGAWCVPLQGSQVMLFFENNNPIQPRYFASMPGIPEAQEQYSNNNKPTSKNDGFKDPDGEYPSKHRLGEPDFHRLARGISEETLVVTKNQQRDIGVPTALGGNWSEPASSYNAQYPHNHVIATHGGITIELDSTPGSTRVNIYHPSNSFIEIDNDGNMVVKNNGEKYEIVASGKNIHIKQQRNITVDGDDKKRVVGNEAVEVGINREEKIDGDVNQTIGGDKTKTVSGNETDTISGDKTKTVSGNETDSISENKTETVGGNKTETVGGNLNIAITGIATVTASGQISIISPIINLTGVTNITGVLTSIGSGGVGGNMTGTFTINGGDIIADGISLKTHVHGGIEPGSGNTGVPV